MMTIIRQDAKLNSRNSGWDFGSVYLQTITQSMEQQLLWYISHWKSDRKKYLWVLVVCKKKKNCKVVPIIFKVVNQDIARCNENKYHYHNEQ